MLPLTDEARAMGRKKAPTLSERLVSAGASEEQLRLASTAVRACLEASAEAAITSAAARRAVQPPGGERLVEVEYRPRAADGPQKARFYGVTDGGTCKSVVEGGHC